MRVMQSSRTLRPTTNPYLKQLYQTVGQHVDLTLFSWREALLGRFDVFHIHWPELLIRGSNRRRTALRRLATLMVLTRIRCSRRVIVRTVHNIEPHEPGSKWEQRLLSLIDRWTTLYILLTPESVPRSDAPSVVIPHGDYISWFSGMLVPPTEPGTILHPGLIRPYKGIEELLSVFCHLDAVYLTLRIVGKTQSEEMSNHILLACQNDRRVIAVLQFVSDEEMATEIGRAQFIVLPYREMHNSGIALLSLSLNRPILVPRNASTDALAREVGDQWVLRFDAPLTDQALTAAELATRTMTGVNPPNLSQRSWPRVSIAHIHAYQAAIDHKVLKCTSHLRLRDDRNHGPV